MGVLNTKQGARLHPKQVQRHQTGYIVTSGFVLPIPGSTMNIGSAMVVAAGTAGRNGTAVSALFSSGIDVSGFVPSGKAIIIDEATNTPPAVDGHEVFGVGPASGTLILTFNTHIATGVSLPAGTYTILYPYSYSFEELPVNALIQANITAVGQDPIVVPLVTTDELLTIATLNTIPNLATTPRTGSSFYLVVNGALFHNLAGSPVVSFSGVVVTWDEVEATFDIEPGDDVVAMYLV